MPVVTIDQFSLPQLYWGANAPLFGAIDAFGCPSNGHLLERPVTGRSARPVHVHALASKCRVEPTVSGWG